MKSERGVTTTTIIVYVIILTVVISMMSVITGFFRSGIRKSLQKNISADRYITFASYFIQDIQQKGNEVLAAEEVKDTDGNRVCYIQFSNGNLYQFSEANKEIYLNQITICEDVDYCRFVHITPKEGKEKVEVHFAAGDFERLNENPVVFYM